MQIIEFARIKEEFKADSLKYVGGKNSSLGNMIYDMAQLGIKVPAGFAITTTFYHQLKNLHMVCRHQDSHANSHWLELSLSPIKNLTYCLPPSR